MFAHVSTATRDPLFVEQTLSENLSRVFVRRFNEQSAPREMEFYGKSGVEVDLIVDKVQTM